MPDIDWYRPDDRRGVEQLYRRTFGTEAADRLRLRWDWTRRNPANAGGDAPYWIVREGPTVIAACPLIPVRVSIRGPGRREAMRPGRVATDRPVTRSAVRAASRTRAAQGADRASDVRVARINA